MAESPLKQLLKDSKLPSDTLATNDIPQVSPSIVSRMSPFLLDFVLVNGNHIALPYTSILSVSFNLSGRIVILFATHTVHVRGINLKAVYDALVAETAGSLKALGERPKQFPNGVPLIQSIDVIQRTGELADTEEA